VAWTIAIALIALGALCLVASLYVNTVQFVDCLRTRSIARASSPILLGPLLITLGYLAAPITGWAYVVWAVWAVEGVVLLSLWLAIQLRHATVRDRASLAKGTNDV
jgi:hypothetical protein